MSENNKIETPLLKTADKLRNNMDAAGYKHVVLGLIFLKYISDSFEELYNKLKSEGGTTGADPEDKDEYTAERVFYVPPSARWTWLQKRARLPTIGKDIDEAMDSVEKDNPSLKGVLPKDYARPALDLFKHDKYLMHTYYIYMSPLAHNIHYFVHDTNSCTTIVHQIALMHKNHLNLCSTRLHN